MLRLRAESYKALADGAPHMGRCGGRACPEAWREPLCRWGREPRSEETRHGSTVVTQKKYMVEINCFNMVEINCLLYCVVVGAGAATLDQSRQNYTFYGNRFTLRVVLGLPGPQQDVLVSARGRSATSCCRC